MHLSLAAMAALAVAASAFPRMPLQSRFAKGNQTNPNDILKTCGNGGRTRDAWKELGIGPWFVKLADSEDKFDTDIQEWIQQQGFTDDLATFHCSPLHECTGSLDYDQCREDVDTARVFFVLHSLQNFNNYMVSLRDGVVATSSIADSKSASMVEDFTVTPEEELKELTSPPIIASAVFGIIGSLLTGPFAAIAALAGGAASMATGLMVNMNENGEELDLEPKFGNFADATKRLGDMTETILKALEQFAKHVLTDTPEQGKDKRIKDDPISAPSMLKDGTFAEPIYADTIPGSIYAAMFATTISSLWKAEQATIVRLKKDEPSIDKPPCENKDLLKDQRWCDDDGNLWALMKIPKEKDGFMLPNPWKGELHDMFLKLKGVDKLKDYNLDIKTVVQSSEKSWKENDEKAWKEWTGDAMIDYLTKNKGDLGDFVPMNLPICDLGDYEFLNKDIIRDTRIDKDECDDLCQILYRVGDECGSPYKKRYPPFNWLDECDFREDACKPICIGGMPGC